MKQSFISNLFGEECYDHMYEYSIVILPIGSVILSILYLLAFNVHWQFIIDSLNVFTGLSLLFILYIAEWIVVLDVQVEMGEKKKLWEEEKESEKKKPLKYKFTIVWGLILLVLGVTAVYYSYRFKSSYQFECNTFLVDFETNTYHLVDNKKCECIEDKHRLIKMRGYEMKKYNNLTLCGCCEEWADYWESSSNIENHYRR